MTRLSSFLQAEGLVVLNIEAIEFGRRLAGLVQHGLHVRAGPAVRRLDHAIDVDTMALEGLLEIDALAVGPDDGDGRHPTCAQGRQVLRATNPPAPG